MMQPAILNFHGIGVLSRRDYEPGERPYWITVERFTAVLDRFAPAVRAGELLLTFDDGNASDFLLGAPALVARHLTASFFVLAGKLDQPDYLDADQARSLAHDFAVGSHGIDHRAWPSLSAAELRREVQGSREQLEDVLGRPITSAAIPFGRYDRRVLREVKRAGYTRIFSSDGGPRLTDTGPVPRLSIRVDTSDAALGDLLRRSRARRIAQELKLRLKALR